MDESKIIGIVSVADSGEPLPGAVLDLEGLTQKMKRTTVSRENGAYFLVDLPPGGYKLTASMSGFKTKVMNDILLSINETLELDFKLELESIQEH